MPARLIVALAAAVANAPDVAACPPAAEVGGEPALAAVVARELAERGVAASAPSGCDAVRARVEGAEGAVAVEVEDAAGRKALRRTSSVAAAATVIESWARVEPAEPGPEVRRVVELPAPGPPPLRTPVVSAAAESSLGSDGSLWAGARLAGCAWLGPVCTGVTLRFAADPGWSGDAHRLPGGRRMSTDLLLAFEIPARTPHLVVAPGVAAGLGWLRSHVDEPEGDSAELDWAGARAEAHLRVGVPVTDSLWLTVAASASVLPSAQTRPVLQDDATLAAEPRGFVRLAVGLSSTEWP
jgi:hypothetical protein